MNTDSLIQYLKTSLFVYDPNSEMNIDDDPEYIALGNDYLEEVIRMSLSRIDPIKDLEDITNHDLYPTMLLAKKEIYFLLATKSAPLYDLSVAGSAGSSRISRDQRFQHYMSLVGQVDKEFNTYMSTGQGGRALTSRDIVGDVFLSSRYYSQRNYELADKPYIRLKVDKIYPKTVEVNWKNVVVDRFESYTLYIDENPVIDKYETDLVKEGIEEVKTFTDIHAKQFRIDDLVPNTSYFVAIVIKEKNGLKSYSETNFTTLEE